MTQVYIPSLAVAILVSVYWLSVLVMAARNWLFPAQDGLAAPSTMMDRVVRYLWFPVIASWVALPYIVAVGHSRVEAVLPWPALAKGPLPWIGVGVAAAALIFTIVCWKEMGSAWQMGIDSRDKPALVFSGPYAFVRHPIYTLSLTLMLATLAAIPAPMMLAVAVLHILMLNWEVRREEHHLGTVHGQDYLDYCRHTGRWLPRSIHPYVGQRR